MHRLIKIFVCTCYKAFFSKTWLRWLNCHLSSQTQITITVLGPLNKKSIVIKDTYSLAHRSWFFSLLIFCHQSFLHLEETTRCPSVRIWFTYRSLSLALANHDSLANTSWLGGKSHWPQPMIKWYNSQHTMIWWHNSLAKSPWFTDQLMMKISSITGQMVT